LDHHVVIAGGGMAGLTAASYLCRAGFKVTLCEKEAKVGGLVNSFEYQGFTVDGGIRAIENSGIVMPMLRQLGLDVPFIKNGVSIGIADQVINLKSTDSLADYLELLRGQFPENSDDIERFGLEIEKIMGYMDILYGIDNPIFMDLKNDRRYLVQTILPWMFKYMLTIPKIARLNQPVVGYLSQISKNPALIDMIAQHFFKDTPTFFALSYFSLYLDYQYPRGGTGTLVEVMRDDILAHQGVIRCETEICSIDPARQVVHDTKGNQYPYESLVWCSDLKRLYQILDLEKITDQKTQRAISQKQKALSDKIGGDSILTLYLTVDLTREYFAAKSNAHFFYTPYKTGLSSLQPLDLNPGQQPSPLTQSPRDTVDQASTENWLKEFFEKTTYEISCPVIRDETMAPSGKTGLIISTLFDYPLAKRIKEQGWYDNFKALCAQSILDVLDRTIYPSLKNKVISQFVSTPLTLARLTGNTDGAITGWAFTNSSMPVVHSMPKIAQSVCTPIPNVYQAGQWVFSPSGLPISILTGKLAADRVIKQAKKRQTKA
jgi:phytoene dehydrogenase-like protein